MWCGNDETAGTLPRVPAVRCARKPTPHGPPGDSTAGCHSSTLRGDLPAARAALAEAIDLFEHLGMRRELAEARDELAQLEAQIADGQRWLGHLYDGTH
jgi:hypothetical protein